MPKKLKALVFAVMDGTILKTVVSIMRCVREPVTVATGLSQMNAMNAQNMPNVMKTDFVSVNQTGVEIVALISIKNSVILPVHHAMDLEFMTVWTVLKTPIAIIWDLVYAIVTGENQTAPSTVVSVISVALWDVMDQQICTATRVSTMLLLFQDIVSVMQVGPVKIVVPGKVPATIDARDV